MNGTINAVDAGCCFVTSIMQMSQEDGTITINLQGLNSLDLIAIVSLVSSDY